jgi:hypothetical protein
VLKKAFPELKPENITFATDLGFGGGFAPEQNEILPTKVIIHEPTGRGILLAPKSTLAHFVPLEGR